MQLQEIGRAVVLRRAELDLTQAQLAKLVGAELSRFTVNQLETGNVVDLAINKLIPLLSVLGLDLNATRYRPEQRGLHKATISANVSYKGHLTEQLLADALTSGHIPEGYESQMSVILDEVPVPVVIKAAEEASSRSGTPLRQI
ncbi:hypothetical protein BRCH_04267 [Candidatus Burkholderia brachyanthoides]|nr:hypothetical protein BRCH_04267 [Candidatus Burkholderia brachyanthoides]